MNPHTRSRLVAAVSLGAVLMLVLALTPARAQVAPAADPEKPPELVTKMYDLTDLFNEVNPPDEDQGFALPTQLRARTGVRSNSGRGGGGGGGGGGLFGGGGGGGGGQGAPESLLERMQAVEKIIQGSIDPESWRDNGGSLGICRIWNARLLITHTPKHHEQIAQVLKLLQPVSTRPLHVRAAWVLLRPEELAPLLKPAPAGTPGAPREIDPVALDKLAAKKICVEGAGLNGRTLRLASGRARTVLTAISAVVGNVAVFEPEIPFVLGGTNFELTPVLKDPDNTLTVTIRAIYGQWNPAEPPITFPRMTTTRPTTTRLAGSKGPEVEQVERLSMTVQSIDTVVRLPLNKMMLISTLTLDAAEGPQQLCLFLEVTAAKAEEPRK